MTTQNPSSADGKGKSQAVGRGSFGGKLGIVLATAGSAVGLGNVWRFPYMMGENGGAAFLFIYMLFVFLLGVPAMVAEFVVGRHGQSSAVRAYSRISGNKAWGMVGMMGNVASTVILGFYAVVAGWCLNYLWCAICGTINVGTSEAAQYFSSFSSDMSSPVGWAMVFLLITHSVVSAGVEKGIERAAKSLMPILIMLLLVLVVASCMLPGAMQGVEFMLRPDFSKVTSRTLLDAMGQAFFSLSLGTACLCTYASYFKRDTNLVTTSREIALLDTGIAILSGLIIFPAAAAVGVNADSGPGLIFITLPAVFQQAFSPTVGYVASIMFYALLSLAALTSTISMHEITTSYIHERFSLPRRSAAWAVTVVCMVLAMLSSLSCGAMRIELAGMSFLDFSDFVTGQFLLPLGGMLTCICVGWFVDTKLVQDEFTNGGAVCRRLFPWWLFLIRFVCPVCIAAIFLHQFGLL